MVEIALAEQISELNLLLLGVEDRAERIHELYQKGRWPVDDRARRWRRIECCKAALQTLQGLEAGK